MNVEEIKKFVINDVKEDFLGLWLLLANVQRSSKSPDSEYNRDLVLGIIEDLLKDGTIVAGTFNKNKQFEIWTLPPEHAVKKIKEEWVSLGRKPNIGEIVWFTMKR